MQRTSCLGYEVYSNGEVLGLKGRPLKKSKQIRIKINGKWKNIEWGRFIYYAFHRDFDLLDKNKTVISIKKGNYSLDKLKVVDRNNYLKGENHVSSKLTQSQVYNIIKEYKDGEIKGLDKNYPNKKVSYRSLAEKYGVSHTVIKNIIIGKSGYITGTK